jgi:uncharacterized protein (DUF427 family)
MKMRWMANYVTLRVDRSDNRDTAWCWPQPMAGAKVVTNRVAFRTGVQVTP